MSKPFVAILMGSESDLSVMQACADVLESFDINYEITITSAHRTPEATEHCVKDAEQRGADVFVAGAGLAAALPGAVAAHTLKPVIGVPLDAGSLGGMDSLLSIAQMPGGIPVACMGIGKHGAKNAGFLAAQMLALNNSELAKKARQQRSKKADEIKATNAKLKQHAV